MALKIKFPCPNAKCKQVLFAPSAQAGKKVRCPHCKAVLRVPAPKATDVEAAAAAALADKPAEPQAPAGKPVKFECPHCDEPIEAQADMAGKQMPCPSCTRVVRVPVPKEGPRDWRNVDKRAAAAVLKGNEPPPEGEWGTATALSRVSADALIEAEAVPATVERLPIARRIARGAVGTAAVLVFLAIAWSGWGFLSHRSNEFLLKRVLKEVDANPEPRLTDLQVAEINRAAGEYYVRAEDTTGATDRLSRAQQRLSGLTGDAAARDLALADLGLTLADLGGDAQEATAQRRVSWQDPAFIANWGRIAALPQTPDGRADFVRRVTAKLAAKGQIQLARTVVNQINSPARDKPELLALWGLVLLDAGKADEAKKVANELLQPYQPRLKNPKLKGERPTPNVLALLVAVGQTEPARSLTGASLQESLKEPFPEVRLGYALGLAHAGRLAEARQQAAAPGPAPQQIEALTTVAEVASTKSDAEPASQAASQAVELVKPLLADVGRSVSPWTLYRLVRAAAAAGVPADSLEPLADAVPPELRDRARLEVTRGRLRGLDRNVAEAELAEPAKYPPLALELLTRQAARLGAGGVIKAVDRWDPPNLRPFGYVGAVLGEQDAVQR